MHVMYGRCNALQGAVGRCRALQRAAVRCSALQSAAGGSTAVGSSKFVVHRGWPYKADLAGWFNCGWL